MLRLEHYTNRTFAFKIASYIISTAIDNQEEITLHILQGDSQKASDCRSIARLQVKGISPAQKRGEPKIKVTFEIEPSGVFQCQARELPNQWLLVEGQPARVDIERSY
jgi:molecular chaperone DnaK (HSP70)